MKIINEALDYHDLVGEVEPRITIDEYAAKMGKDKDVVTMTFTVKSKLCGEDLVSWLETGYDFVLDAAVSDGEFDNDKWLVFVEFKRRSHTPEKIIEILEDLQTLTDLKLTDWTVFINDESYDANTDILRQVMILSPKEYAKIKRREEKDDKELNQMRDIANLDHPENNDDEEVEPMDQELKEFINRAGL